MVWPPRAPSNLQEADRLMPTFRVLAWRSIPTQVEVIADDGTSSKRAMPGWFMQEISRITMREGLAATDDYLDEFAWSEPAAREGDVESVMASVITEQAARFGRKADGHPLEGVGRYAGNGA
jgi:hypothetical protein